jgi:hypothetical protein
MKTTSYWLHYGDPEHRPFQTVRFTGGRRALLKKIKEAREDKWPLKVQPMSERDAKEARK